MGWAVGTSWLEYIPIFPKNKAGQSARAGQLAALVGANRSAQLAAKWEKKASRRSVGGSFVLVRKHQI